MRKLIALLFLASLCLQSQDQKTEQKGEHTQHSSQYAPLASNKPKSASDTSENEGKQFQPKESPAPTIVNQITVNPKRRDHWDLIEICATCALALVGLVGLIFAFGTLKSTEKAANAARLNAQAVIDNERGWLEVSFGNIKLPKLVTPDILSIFCLFPHVTNRGKTVCKLTEMYITRTFNKSALGLPCPPIYDKTIESSFLSLDLPMFPESPLAPLDRKISMREVNRARSREEMLFVYGYVQYEIKGLPTETTKFTRFCFVYNLPGGYSPLPEGFLMPTGVSEYTKSI
jgi:hypothetical protein